MPASVPLTRVGTCRELQYRQEEVVLPTCFNNKQLELHIEVCICVNQAKVLSDQGAEEEILHQRVRHLSRFIGGPEL